MNLINEIETNDNNASASRAKQFIGIPITGEDFRLLNGEIQLTFDDEEKPVTCRFIDGMLDGNIYDADGHIAVRRPALEYSFGGKEYWSHGFPDGPRAIQQNYGYYEEDWKNGRICKIRNELILESMEPEA